MVDGSEEYNLLVVSDLHLSEGLDQESGKISPREDFFFDQEFARFLEYHDRLSSEDPRCQGHRWKLILNGDVFDFLQVVAKPRISLHTFDEGQEDWLLMQYLPAGQRCYAANGSLRLEVAFSGEPRQQAGVARYWASGADLSGYARLRARVRIDDHAQGLQVTFRLKTGSDLAATQLQWVHLEPGVWSEVAFDLSEASKLPLQHVRAVQLRVASNIAQDITLCVDEVWAEPLISPREERYGLGTTPEHAAWKLRYSGKNHPVFFQALARFLAQGHRVVHIKGNHDVDTHWPLVQDTFRDLISEAAQQCPDLVEVDRTGLRERIEFCRWVYYEPGLAYIEHGNQYEPGNFFRDFLNPVLPEDPQRLELPLGSFLVRYMFNFLEAVHPWADNLKPATEYVKWVFKQDFFGALGTLTDNLGLILLAVWQAFRKRAVVPRVDHSLWDDKEGRRRLLANLPPDAMWEVAELSHQRVAGWWRRIVRTVALGALSFALLIGIFVLLLGSILDFIRLGFTSMPWLVTAGQLVGSAVLYVLRRLVAHRIAAESKVDYLLSIAKSIGPILNRHGLEVRYLVFGHTHSADVVKLPRQPELSYDQWYVNTGTWTQVWSEEERLVRDRKQFSFLKVLRDEGLGRPTLLHWNDDGGRPAPVLILKE